MAKSSFYFPVVDDSGRMTGIISMQDVKNILHRAEEERVCYLVGGICSRDVIMLTPDDSLYTAMQLFDVKGIEEIPVVEDLENKWVVGMLKRRDVIAAYNHEVFKERNCRKSRNYSDYLRRVEIDNPVRVDYLFQTIFAKSL